MSTLSQLLVLYWIYHIASGQCPPNWEERNYGSQKICYYFSGLASVDKKNWQDAQNDCRSKGSQAGITANLVKIDSSAKQDYLKNKLKADDYEYTWIGATETSHEWKWVTSQAYLKDQGCFRETSSSDFQPRTLSKQTRSNCEDACSADGRKYAAVMFSDDQNTVLVCKCGSMFNPMYDNDVVTACDKKCPGNDTQNCGSFQKMLVSRLSGTTGVQWSANQPNNFENYQGCLFLNNDNNLKLADEYCYRKFDYLCQYNLPQSECSGGSFQYISNKCISIHFDTQTWYKARSLCMNNNNKGDLLAVDSKAFYDALVPVINGRSYWTGGISKTWSWSDGDVVVGYTNWVRDQPNSSTEKCAVIYKNTGSTDSDKYSWEDQSCTNTFSYACEYSVTTKPTTTTTKAPGSGGTTTTLAPGQSTTTTVPQGGSTRGQNVTTTPTSDALMSDLSTGEIAAIAVAAVAVFLGLVRLLVYCCYRSRKEAEDQQYLT